MIILIFLKSIASISFLFVLSLCEAKNIRVLSFYNTIAFLVHEMVVFIGRLLVMQNIWTVGDTSSQNSDFLLPPSQPDPSPNLGVGWGQNGK